MLKYWFLPQRIFKEKIEIHNFNIYFLSRGFISYSENRRIILNKSHVQQVFEAHPSVLNVRGYDDNNQNSVPQASPTLTTSLPDPNTMFDFRPTDPGHSPGVGHDWN